MLGIIKKQFISLDTETFIMLYKTLIRKQLNYAVIVRNPKFYYLIDNTEKVQKATKTLKKCRNLIYMQQLRFSRLPLCVCVHVYDSS